MPAGSLGVIVHDPGLIERVVQGAVAIEIRIVDAAIHVDRRQRGRRLTQSGHRRAIDWRGAPILPALLDPRILIRSEEPTSELQSLMHTSYAVFCLQKKQ